MTEIEQLEARFARLGAVQETISMLHWDAATVMPSGGAEARGEQVAALELICHELLTDPALGAMIETAAGRNDLEPWRRATVAEMRRQWLHATAVPGDLVTALAKASLECEQIWRKARPANDFALVKPALGRLLDLTRQSAAAKAEKFGVGRYDALLDSYEPGGAAAEIDRQFAELGAFLPELIGAALGRQAARAAPIRPEGPFPVEAQRRLGETLMAALGFDFAHGRLDVSAHPFSGGTPDDTRITTRYSEDDFSRAMMGVLHETGHALYERGLPAAWRRQPVGTARGMSLHESQSLLIEMQACRSREFMEYLAPLARDAFGGQGPAWEPENLHRLALRVERGFIRVDADEVTYPAHVILRYRLERALIEDRMRLDDLPGAWRDGMREFLGVTPDDDRDGCLQDIHWYGGAWGYFPTYTLGAMTAAQLFDAATRADPAIRPALAKGDFTPLLAWLRPNIHERASSASTAEIIEDATGKPLDVQVFRRHLEERYLR
jgi:carboxypeptidase Taq